RQARKEMSCVWRSHRTTDKRAVCPIQGLGVVRHRLRQEVRRRIVARHKRRFLERHWKRFRKERVEGRRNIEERREIQIRRQAQVRKKENREEIVRVVAGTLPAISQVKSNPIQTISGFQAHTAACRIGRSSGNVRPKMRHILCLSPYPERKPPPNA